MTINEKLVSDYLELFFSPKHDLQAIRKLLSDSFTFCGPLLQANSANEYIKKIQGVASGGLSMKNAELISGSDQVAILYDMISPLGEVRTVEWFKIKDGKIHSLELLNDPRVFIEAFQSE